MRSETNRRISIFKNVVFSVCLLSAMSGCGLKHQAEPSPSDTETAGTSEDFERWDAAMRKYSRQAQQAQLDGEDPATRASAFYRYGRAAGVRCYFEHAEQALLMAYELDVKSNGPAYMALTELFRLKLDQNDYAEAAQYFEMAVPMYNRINAIQADPAGFAELMREYQLALERLKRDEEAKAVAQKAEQLESQISGLQPQMDRTPYGTQCGQPLRTEVID